MFTFKPQPAYHDPLIKVADAGLTDEALARISGYGDTLIALREVTGDTAAGRVGFGPHGRVDPAYRITQVGWLQPGLPETQWVYAVLEDLILRANWAFWRLKLAGFYDEVQYCRYHGGPDSGGHFTWHMDLGDQSDRPQRKLAITLQLSEQGVDYEGGDFYVFDGGEQVIKAARQKGSVAVFPAWVQHAVEPVTAGTRRTLVAWACGWSPFE